MSRGKGARQRYRARYRKHSKISRSEYRLLKAWIIAVFPCSDGTYVPCYGRCGKYLDFDTITLDRFPVPFKHGGKYKRGNIRPMCRPCNCAHVGEPPD